MRIERHSAFNPHSFYGGTDMTGATYEQVVADIRQLPLTDQQRLSDQLARELAQRENYSPLEKIAREQGKRPVSWEELLGPEPEFDV
jgi:hypothetical protein